MLNAYNKYNYPRLISDPRTVIIADDTSATEQPFISIIIGTCNRHKELHTCLLYLRHALKHAGFPAYITVVEINKVFTVSPLIQSMVNKYVFVPADICEINEKFSRGLAFDIGFMLSPAAYWVMNLDNDLLMNYNFFTNLHQVLCGDHPSEVHIQPYGDKRVRRLSAAVTQRLYVAPGILDLDTLTEYSLPAQGACGGAIIVSWQQYINAGGYDEYFFDWAPEDQLFFLKLECLAGKVKPVKDAHQGHAIYANDNYLVHLEHEKLWDKNPHLPAMEKIWEEFCALPYEQKMQYIRQKADNFKEQMKQVRK